MNDYYKIDEGIVIKQTRKHRFVTGLKFTYCENCYKKWDNARTKEEQMKEGCEA